MGHPQEKVQVPVTDLPNPELNPLLNPTLGRNLGRWAEVYFTSPPEKREKAVVELLRELQGESPSAGGDAESAPASGFRGQAPETAENREAAVFCAECGSSCGPEQRFCGMCGASLQANAGTGASGRFDAGYEREFSQRGLSTGFTGSELASLQPVRSSYSTDTYSTETRSDVPWLREKDEFSAPSGARKFVPAVVAALAVGVLFYAQFRPRHETLVKRNVPAATNASPTTPPQAAAPAQGAATQAPAAQTAPVAANGEKDSKQNASSTPAGEPSARPAAKSNAVAGSEAPPLPEPAHAVDTRPEAPHRALEPAQPDSTSSGGNGSAELTEAESFLNGKKGAHDSAAAARLLWRAVAKENGAATLLLSDLYLMGDGVPKSCDQARLLLTAAARKHVPQATEKLTSLLRSGCP